MPELSVLKSPIERRIHHINKIAMATGFGPLTIQEIAGILKKVEPPKPINGIQPPDEIVDPMGGSSADAGVRDLLSRSRMPVPGAMSGVMNPLDATGSQFAPMTGLMSDQFALQDLRGPQGQGI